MLRSVCQCIKIVIQKTKIVGFLDMLVFLIEGFCFVIQLFMLQLLVNQLVDNMANRKLFVYVLLYILSFLPEVLCRFFRCKLELKMSKMLVDSISEDIINKVNRMDYFLYENEELYQKYTRLGSEPHESIKKLFFTTMQTIKMFFTLLSASIIVFQFSVKLSILFVITLILIIVLSTIGMNIYNKALREKTKDERWSEYFHSLLCAKNTNIELRVNDAVDYVASNRKKHENVVVKEMFLAMFKADVVYNMSTVLIIIWSSIAIFSISKTIISGGIIIGTFVALIETIISMMERIENLSASFSDLVQDVRYIEYYNEFMRLPEKESTIRISKLKDDILIDVNNVSYRYSEDSDYVLKGISLELKKNTTTAIVGANGAGKSTLLKILCGLLTPNKGEIKYSESANTRLGMVFQDYAKYWMSVRENVGISETEFIQDDDRIRLALDCGELNEMVDKLEGTIDCEIGRIDDQGIELSGGQWQRLSIARGCFVDADVIFLDEPTASMDPITESKLYSTFRRIKNHKTCIIISHRLATAKFADQIILLNDGEIGEIGTHDELISKNGLYAEMYKMQSSWFE